MKEGLYKPTGELQGDTRPMPNRGTETGMTGQNTHCMGTDKGVDATNSRSGLKSHTGSDPMDRNMPVGER